MAEPVKLITQTPIGNRIEITLKRWFQTREFWLNLCGWVATVGPIALTMISNIGLSPVALMVWVVILQSVLFAANQYLKNTSKSQVVSKAMMTDERAASDV